MVGSSYFCSHASRRNFSQSFVALCRRQILPLGVVVLGALVCLHLMAGFVFSHRQCFTPPKALKRSWSHDFLQVLYISLSSFSLTLFFWFCSFFFPFSDLILNRELSKKAQKANNVWWRLSGLLGDQNRLLMFILLQAVFTVATMALTVPIFLSYELHVVFQILKVSASVWNGGSFLLEVMPRQVILKEKKKLEVQPVLTERDQSTDDDGGTNNSAEASSPN